MQDLRQQICVLKQHGYRQDESLILLMRLQLIKIIKAKKEAETKAIQEQLARLSKKLEQPWWKEWFSTGNERCLDMHDLARRAAAKSIHNYV